MRSGDTSIGGSRADFPETVLDVIRRAADASPDVQREGFDEICRSYWKPAYHYFRVAWAKSNEDAKDLAQAFFLWLGDPRILKRFDPQRASFRTYLKSLLRHFVQRNDQTLGRLKRGGGRMILNLDDPEVFSEAGLGDARSAPEPAFEADWRKAVIDRAVEDVRERLRAGEKSVRFEVFEQYYLPAGPERPTYEELALKHGLKLAEVHRYLAELRKEVRQSIRSHLAETASTPGELEEEWNAFFPA